MLEKKYKKKKIKLNSLNFGVWVLVIADSLHNVRGYLSSIYLLQENGGIFICLGFGIASYGFSAHIGHKLGVLSP